MYRDGSTLVVERRGIRHGYLDGRCVCRIYIVNFDHFICVDQCACVTLASLLRAMLSLTGFRIRQGYL